jgi:hypothetical protein
MQFSDGGSDVCGSFVIDIKRNRLDGKYLRSNGLILDEFTILKKNLQAASQISYTVCSGESITLSSLHTGGSDNLSFEWSFSTAGTADIVVSPLSDMTYTLIVTDQLTGQQVTTSYIVDVISCVASLSENEQLLSVYPNPANDQIKIKSDLALDQIAIFDLNGKCLFRQKSNKKSMSVDVSSFEVGAYIISVEYLDRTVQKKVLISR